MDTAGNLIASGPDRCGQFDHCRVSGGDFILSRTDNASGLTLLQTQCCPGYRNLNFGVVGGGTLDLINLYSAASVASRVIFTGLNGTAMITSTGGTGYSFVSRPTTIPTGLRLVLSE